MCQFFSCIIDKREKVYWKEGVDDHCKLIRLFNLKDDTIDPEMMSIAKVEITPFERNIFSNSEDWHFKLDEKIRPDWFCPAHEKACFEALKICVKNIDKYFLGNLYLTYHKHPLPKNFTHCRGNLDLKGYDYPLPEGFTHCGGYLYLNEYKYSLPKSFTCCGDLYLGHYNHPLPEGFSTNGFMFCRGYNYSLPKSLNFQT